MLVETLLWECFAAPAQLSDSDLTAVVQAHKPASLMALQIDTTAFRRAMKLEKTPLCDGLFLGISREDNQPRVYCLFVELKGKDIGHAVTQLENTIRVVRDHLQHTLSESSRGRTRFSAVIVSDRASLTRDVTKDDMRRFQKELKSTLHVRHAERRGAPVDLSALLWKLPMEAVGPQAID